MNTNNPIIERIGKSSGMAIAIGMLIALLGVLALSAPLATGIAVGSVIGFFLLISGIAQLIFAFKSGGGVWPYVAAVLTLLAGGYMAFNPAVAAATLTLILLVFLFGSGIADILLSFQLKPEDGWGWLLCSGALSVVLGVMMWGQFPFSGDVAIGILLGIRLLFGGIALAMLGLRARGAVNKVKNLAGA